MQTSSNPGIINDDARLQIWPFFPFRDPALFPNDYLRDYVLNAFSPLGYRLTFTLLAPLVDPSVLSKVLPYLLLGATLASVSIASLRLGGLTSFFAAGGLCLSSEVFLSRMAGGLPRAFGFPVLALALLGLASGRVVLLITAILIGAAFYPAAAVAPGLALAFLLLLVPQQDRGSAREWSFRRRVFVLGSVATISVLLTLPVALGGRAFGSRIAPSQVGEYPEAGPGGRWGLGDRAPFSGFPRDAVQHTKEAFRGGGEPVLAGILPHALEGRLGLIAVLGLLALMGLGLLLLSFRDAAGRRVAALAIAVIVGHSLARAFAPYLYLPERQVLYSIPVLALCLVPTSAFVLGGFLGGRMRRIGGPAAVLLVTGFCWAFFGAGVGAWTGLMDVRQDMGVHSFLTSLPKDVLVAGFPGGKIEGVPYFSRRRALLTFETHQAFHTGYVEEMRRRMRALITAYFATEVAPITRLHDEFGVTHLIIDREHFGPEAPPYIEPFTADIRKAHAAGRGKGFAALKLAEDSTAFSERDIFILDLRRVRPTSPGS